MVVKVKKSAKPVDIALLKSLIDKSISPLELCDEELYKLNDVILFRHSRPNRDRKRDSIFKLVNKYSYRRKLDDKKKLAFIRANNKTGDSIDFSPDCQFECVYCYINAPHTKEQLANKDWTLDANDTLDYWKVREFVEYLRDRKEISKYYPLRFFSLSDCPDDQIDNLCELLEICESESVPTIVISKNRKVHESPASELATTILYSIDNGSFNSPTSIEEYVELFEMKPKIRAFFMVTDFKDLRLFNSWIVKYKLWNFQMVSYHGQFMDSDMRKAPVKIPAQISPMLLDIITDKLYRQSLGCCSVSRCMSCSFKCGIKSIRSSYRLKTDQ